MLRCQPNDCYQDLDGNEDTGEYNLAYATNETRWLGFMFDRVVEDSVNSVAPDEQSTVTYSKAEPDSKPPHSTHCSSRPCNEEKWQNVAE